MSEHIIKVIGLSKYYSGVKALDDVSMEIEKGEIHALCGENGAGKSTLIKLLSGAEEPTAGEIIFDGQSYRKLNPKQSHNMGISVIYQEFSLLPYLTVAENIYFGRELMKGAVRDVARMNEETVRLCKEIGIELNPRRKVCELGVAYQQIVEILKAVSRKAKLIIMDEPTAPLTTKETALFFNVVEKLKADNVTVIFISHRLEEIFEICDRVTVLCDGRYISTREVGNVSKRELIADMVGRELEDTYPKAAAPENDILLDIKDLTNHRVKDVSFSLRRGEILGFGGLVGAGRTELASAIFGADKISAGSMTLKGNKYSPQSPKQALAMGVGLIPEDRKRQGVILGMSLRHNITYSILKRCRKFFTINRKTESETVNKYIKDLRIKTYSDRQLVKNLSGGNQQKVVLAKTLASNCDVLIFDEPTRGIDVGAKQEIYGIICRLASEGKGIIMISSEMPELIGMSERIIVMSGGKIAGILQKNEFLQERILELASSGLQHK